MEIQEHLRLTDFEPGQVWLLNDPVRLVRVSRASTIERAKRGEYGVENETVQAIVVDAAIPTKPIDGMWTPAQAAQAQLNAESIESMSELEDTEVRATWSETWSEKMYAQPKRLGGTMAIIVDDINGPFYARAYCHAVDGDGGKIHSSSCLNRPIVGTPVPADKVPDIAWGESLAPKTNLSDMSYRDLQRLAGERGIKAVGAKKEDLLAQLSV